MKEDIMSIATSVKDTFKAVFSRHDQVLADFGGLGRLAYGPDPRGRWPPCRG
jgi:hypothetical protein